MTDRGEFIEVDIGQVQPQLPDLLKAVEERHRTIHVVRGGTLVAEITPPHARGALPVYPELTGVQFNVDPAAPLSEEDWPEQSR